MMIIYSYTRITTLYCIVQIIIVIHRLKFPILFFKIYGRVYCSTIFAHAEQRRDL